MKLATVGGVHFQVSLDMIGLSRGYHFAEPLPLLTNPDYRSYYHTLGQKGYHIIVDNGMVTASYGESDIPFEKVVEVARYVYASEIVMPDKLFDGDWTFKHSLGAYPLVAPHKRLVVPHGANWDDWLGSLLAFLARGEFSSIGIGKKYEQLPGGRAYALKILRSTQDIYSGYGVHLLGLQSDQLSVLEQLTTLKPYFSMVRGMDTSAPFSAAQRGVSIKDYKIDMPYVWDQEDDTGEQRQQAVYNYLQLKEWIDEIDAHNSGGSGKQFLTQYTLRGQSSEEGGDNSSG